ncbi:MAG: hypothetical protein K2O03_00555 [Lachnospiraceae bacterium]|nr:hypothetical protein [Lachnospiraceae bacterium]
MKKYRCLCCGCRTLDARGEYDICPVCFWEDEMYPYIKDGALHLLRNEAGMDDKADGYTGEDVLDVESGANHGLTLRQGRENYKNFGACEKSMAAHVRKPHPSEIDGEML